MKSSPPYRGLHTVAQAAGVAPITVSRVLRNSKHVAPSTREKVQRVLKQIGYRPDPQITHLMARVRSYRQHRVESVIAVVRDDIPEHTHHDVYQFVSTCDIRNRAERYGYRVEEFFLGSGGVSAQRLVGILKTRGIEGLIVSPQSSSNFGAMLDYSHFAAATIGYGLQGPTLHRAGTNMTRGIMQSAAELVARGYKRIGLAITQWSDARSDQTYSGAMLNFQRILPPRQRVPLLLFQKNNLSQEASTFCQWVRKYQPDAIISFNTYIPDWLTQRLGLRIPDDIGLVVHDWGEHMTGFAGIHHRRQHVAAALVDLIATQLSQNERGVPEAPRQILIPSIWIDGPSIRPR